LTLSLEHKKQSFNTSTQAQGYQFLVTLLTCKYDINIGNSIAPKVPLTAQKYKRRNNTSLQSAIGLSAYHTNSPMLLISTD
jgi:hypothetical protein